MPSATTTLTNSLNDYSQSLQTQEQQYSGVSLDQQAIQIMQYQESYQASAKLISTIDQLFQTLVQDLGHGSRSDVDYADSWRKHSDQPDRVADVENINTVENQLDQFEEQVSNRQPVSASLAGPDGLHHRQRPPGASAAANQYQTNTTTDQSFLSNTDSALTNVVARPSARPIPSFERPELDEHCQPEPDAGHPGPVDHRRIGQYGQYPVQRTLSVWRQRFDDRSFPASGQRRRSIQRR